MGFFFPRLALLLLLNKGSGLNATLPRLISALYLNQMLSFPASGEEYYQSRSVDYFTLMQKPPPAITSSSTRKPLKAFKMDNPATGTRGRVPNWPMLRKNPAVWPFHQRDFNEALAHGILFLGPLSGFFARTDRAASPASRQLTNDDYFM